jgi:hypothetical protein
MILIIETVASVEYDSESHFSYKRVNIVACLLEARIMKPPETGVVAQRLRTRPLPGNGSVAVMLPQQENRTQQ